MARQVNIDLYCEDEGHEVFVRALILRLARAEGLRVSLRTPSGRGGHGKAIAEFKIWQRAVERGLVGGLPDLLVLVIDGNCTEWHSAQRELEKLINTAQFPRWVVGCPDPHIERWCLADPVGFQQVVGAPPPPDPGKCERDYYKRLLRETAHEAEVLILTDEMELAPDFVRRMDLYQAGKNQRSLGHFIDALKKALKGLVALATEPIP